MVPVWSPRSCLVSYVRVLAWQGPVGAAAFRETKTVPLRVNCPAVFDFSVTKDYIFATGCLIFELCCFCRHFLHLVFIQKGSTGGGLRGGVNPASLSQSEWPL